MDNPARRLGSSRCPFCGLRPEGNPPFDFLNLVLFFRPDFPADDYEECIAITYEWESYDDCE